MMIDLLVALAAATAFGWSYYRLLRGTGLLVGGILEVLVGLAVLMLPQVGQVIAGGLILAALVIEVVYQRRRKAFSGVRLIFEGGGIRRGLTPVEVAVFLGLRDKEILVSGILGLLQKGFIIGSKGDQIAFQVAEPLEIPTKMIKPKEKRLARKAAARMKAQILDETEDILIELIRQNGGQPLGELAVGVWLEQLHNQVEAKMGGFNSSQTGAYYDAYIIHRLNGVAAGHFSSEEYAVWMALALVRDVIPADSLRALLQKTHPTWLLPGVSYDVWLEGLFASVRS